MPEIPDIIGRYTNYRNHQEITKRRAIGMFDRNTSSVSLMTTDDRTSQNPKLGFGISANRSITPHTRALNLRHASLTQSHSLTGIALIFTAPNPEQAISWS